MKRKLAEITALVIVCILVLSSCASHGTSFASEGNSFRVGYGECEIGLPTDTDEPLYIAGYQNGCEIQGVLDLPKAKAVWIDTGGDGVLLIGIDCVGLGGGTVEDIRQALSDFCRDVGCVSVNVYATHTHAGIDTLGLWGQVAIDGKNADYMQNLITAAVSAAKSAYDDRSSGKLYFGSAEPQNLLWDSREPIEYDPALDQIRFVSDDAHQNGIRLLSYAAHAESLRGDNRLLSADFPGVLAEKIMRASGDDVMYMPSAIGGLIMTRELVEPFDAVENRNQTAQRLADAVLSVREEHELEANLAISSKKLDIPLDNTYFFFGKFLGILDHQVKRGQSETGYILESEIGALKLGSVTIALIPGEIFPELVSGKGLQAEDPESLESIAARCEAGKLLVLGLCNDELGYIVPPSAFKLNDELPYIEPVDDGSGENHYEETNSVGFHTAEIIAEAFEELLRSMN